MRLKRLCRGNGRVLKISIFLYNTYTMQLGLMADLLTKRPF